MKMNKNNNQNHHNNKEVGLSTNPPHSHPPPHKTFSMPHIPSLSLNQLSQQHENNSSTTITTNSTSSRGGATTSSTSTSSTGQSTPRALFESLKRKLSRGFLSPRSSSPPTNNNNTMNSSFSSSLDQLSSNHHERISNNNTKHQGSTSFVVVEDDPTLLSVHHHSVTTTTNTSMTDYSISPPTSPLNGPNHIPQQMPTSPTTTTTSSLSPSSRTSSFSSIYSLYNASNTHHSNATINQISTPKTPSSPGTNSSSSSSLTSSNKKLKKKGSFLSLLTNVKSASGGSVGSPQQQKSQPPVDSLFDETRTESEPSPRVINSKKKKASNSSSNYEEDLSIKTNNLFNRSRNRSKSASNQLDILPKLSLFNLATSPSANNSILTPNSSIISDGGSPFSAHNAESPRSATSPRVSFQRLTLGSAADDAPLDEYLDTTDDEYRQLMDSENGREIFFAFIQKHSHSEQIEFLQETIRLYQDNASILPRCTSPSSNALTNNDNFSFSTSLPDSGENQMSRCFSPPSGSSFIASTSMFDSAFEAQSSVPNFSSSTTSIGTLKKVISKNKLSKQSNMIEDRSLISTSEILMRYKQQKMQNIQQSISSQPSQQPHVFFGFNLYHIDNLVNKFIVEHSPKELNLSKKQRQKVLDYFEKLKIEKLEFLNREVYVEGAGVKEIPLTLYTDILVTEVEFVEIFREIISVINLQLKLECFREFRNSKEYLDVILSNMGDVIGVASVVGSMNQDKLEALVSPRRNILNRLGKSRRLSEADLNKSEFISSGSLFPFGERQANSNIKTPRTMMRNMKNPLELFQLFANIHPHHR